MGREAHPLVIGIKNLLFPDTGKALFRKVEKLQMEDQLQRLQQEFDAQRQKLTLLELSVLHRTGKSDEQIAQMGEEEIMEALGTHMNKIEARRLKSLAVSLTDIEVNIHKLRAKIQSS